MNPSELINDLGLPVAILIALAWFGAHTVWPFVVKQVEQAQTQLAETQKAYADQARAFLVALEKRDTQFERVVGVLDEALDRLDEVSARIEALPCTAPPKAKPPRRSSIRAEAVLPPGRGE